MLTNTLLLYMTQEAIAKARARLSDRKDESTGALARQTPTTPQAWQLARRKSAKPRSSARH